ncbi:MAG: ribulose-phosphate 3-epimerase [Acidobacteria bacterium]|nr:MAG: ribulose-phosphate 3-epimerase [Acidobacteriota bacterium]
MIQLAPSILSADFSRLGEQVDTVVRAGAEVVHIDVMDGHFVPNLTMGPIVVDALRQSTQAILDVHLMITNPEDYILPFAKAGADWISFHIETAPHAHRICQQIHDQNVKAGIAINPGTPVQQLEEMIHHVDFVLLMSVNPGFGGQTFIPRTYQRLVELNKLINNTENKPFIEVDGGVGTHNIARLTASGVKVCVAGSSVFGRENPAEAVQSLLSEAGALP